MHTHPRSSFGLPALLSLLVWLGLGSSAQASPITITLRLQEVRSCCELGGGADNYFEVSVNPLGVGARLPASGSMKGGDDGGWFTPDQLQEYTFTADDSLGTVQIVIAQYDADPNADTHIDMTMDGGDNVVLDLDLTTFTWRGANGDFCTAGGPTIGCLAGRSRGPDSGSGVIDHDAAGGLTWTIDFEGVEVCDGIDNDGNGEIDDGRGSCITRIALVPVCWAGTQAEFDAQASSQIDFFAEQSGLGMCSQTIGYRIFPVAGNPCADGLDQPNSDCASSIRRLARFRAEQDGFELGENFDMIAGLTDGDLCGLIAGGSGQVMWGETKDGDIVVAHEFGHTFVNLHEEYCAKDQGATFHSCNDPNSPNRLTAALGCDPSSSGPNACCNDSIRNSPKPNPTDPACASEVGGIARCCSGNLAIADPATGDLSNNTEGGRCIMSYVTAPGPRGFCRACFEQFQTKGFTCDALFSGTNPLLSIYGSLREDGTLEVSEFRERSGRLGFAIPEPTSERIIELSDENGAPITVIGLPVVHADLAVPHGADEVWLRFPVELSSYGRAKSVRVVRSADGAVLSQTTVNGRAPTARAGADRAAECVQARGTFQLSALSSSDPDGDSLRVRWIAPPGVIVADADEFETSVSAPLGSHVLTLEVSDGVLTSTDSVVLTVFDTQAPVLTQLPPDRSITNCQAPDLGAALATDQCGLASVASNAPPRFPLGQTTVTWTATDFAGHTTTGTQTVTGALRDDVSCCPAGTNIIHGTTGKDSINGTAGSDCILGHGSTASLGDSLDGRGGNDFIAGGRGRDRIEGEAGNDVLWGWEDDDDLEGDDGNDVLYGGDGEDELNGNDGNDICYGGAGDDDIEGDDDVDIVHGEGGNDFVSGGSDPDQVFGGPGNDHLHAGTGADVLNGGPGADECHYTSSQDTASECE